MRNLLWLCLLLVCAPSFALSANGELTAWCVNGPDNPTVIRHVSVYFNFDSECEVWVDDKNVESTLAYTGKVANDQCYREFRRVALDQKDDGFTCGGSTYVGNRDWDLTATMEIVLGEVREYLRFANAISNSGVVVFDVTPDFGSYNPWEWDNEIEDDCGDGPECDSADDDEILPLQRIQSEMPTTYATFGVAIPQNTDQYEAYLAVLDADRLYSNSSDPSVNGTPGWNVFPLRNRSAHPCFGGEEDFLESLDPAAKLKVVIKGPWGEFADNCPTEPHVKRAEVGSFMITRDDGIFLEAGGEP
ncbi:hypothetical protein [Rhizobium wenxiniae]|uniref:hypothetical protein n=1 Tax=Rhizobium wenxiniae TaxID=1737357 RepID=UPI003C21C0EA